MREPLSNQLITRCLLAFLVALIVPSVAWGQTTESVSINGTEITAGNSVSIGDGTASLAYADSKYTLTLDNVYFYNTSNYHGISITGIETLYVNLIGENIFVIATDNKYLFYSNESNGTTIIFTSTASSASLSFSDRSMSTSALQSGNITLDYNNIFQYNDIGDVDKISPIEYGIIFYIPANETTVTVNSLNKGNVFAGDEINDGKVSYTALSNTLNLSDATLSSSITYTGTENLTIALSGANTLGDEQGYICWGGTSEVNIPTLTFTGSSSCSLALSCNDGVISGFSGVTYGDGLYLHTYAPSSYSNNSLNNLIDPSGSVIDSVTISTTPSYDLWVGGVQATSGTITGITYGSYNSINGTVSFNPEGNILTMSDASSIVSTDSQYGPIISNLPNLTIKFEGLCGLRGYQNGSLNTGIPAIKSLVADAPLLFTSDDAENSQLKVDGSTLSDGCTVSTENQLIYELSAGYYYVRKLKKPGMGLDGGLYININSDNTSEDIALYYKIITADGTVGDEQTYSDMLEITSPCTIKAYAKYQGQVSDTAVAKYFGYATKPIKAVYTGSAIDVTPTFAPSLESTDGISTYMMGTNVNVNNNTSTVTMTEIGSGIISTQFETSGTTANTTLLNQDTIQCQVLMLPPAPTVKRAAGEYLSTDSITITKNDTNDNTTLWYKWGEDGTETQYTDSIPVQEGTLYTWVKYYNSTASVYPTLYSDTTSVVYTVKTDIATCNVNNLVNGTYTGSAITPSFELATPNSETSIILTPVTDYTISYKQGETTINEIVSAGTYTIIATGTGSYGGTKEISYTVDKAAGSISYGTSAINKQVGDDNFTNELTKVGDGTIEYASSDVSVATVDQTTGEVTIKAGGSTTITATATDGDNYTYATPTASYTITVAFFTNGSGTEADPYLIKTVSDLKNFASQVNNGKINTKYFKLANNIDCTDITDFTPIGYNNSFKGTFDGNNKTISNLKGYQSLFHNVGVAVDENSPGYIKNLTLSNCAFSNGNEVGTIAYCLSNGSIENCTVTGCSVTTVTNGQSPQAGGIVAELNGGTISGCTVSNTSITASSTYTGGTSDSSAGAIAGRLYKDSQPVVISSNTINAVTILSESSYGAAYGGGIVANLVNGASETITISGNEVNSTTSITCNDKTGKNNSNAGAILGYIDSDVTLSNNIYKSSVTTTCDGTTLSGYEQRGIGYKNVVDASISNYDVSTNDGAVLYTKTVALAIGISGDIEGYSGNYYDGYDDNLHFAPGQTGKIQITAPAGYAISTTAPTLTYNDTESVTCKKDDTIESGNVYSFTMPDANAAMNVTYVKDLSYSGYTFESSSATYTGSAVYPETITLKETDKDDVTLTKGTDFTITGYKNSSNTTVESITNAGEYKVTITGIGNYTGTKEDIAFTVEQATATIAAADQSTTYSGSAVEYSTENITTDPESVKENVSVAYYNTDPSATQAEAPEALAEAPTNAGTYYVQVSLNENNYKAEPQVATLKIEKAAPTVTTAPTATNPTYTGSAQELLSGGEVSNGTLQYVIGTDAKTAPTEGFSATVPSGTDAGTYYVWYKVVGNTNYSDTDPAVITSTIGKADISPSVTIAGWTYGATASTPAVTAESNPGSGTPTYTYKVKDADDNTYTSTVPTDAGAYTIKADVPETTNYNSGTGTADFTISKATPTINKAPAALETLVYSSQAQALITAGEVTGGEMQYSTDNETFTTTIPTGTNAGTYNIYYKVVGATNYNDIPASEVPLEVKIAQANIANVIIANIDDKTYTGEAYQPEVTVTFNDLTVPAEEYTVSYSNNTEAGEATVTLTSSNVNFAEGTKTANFTITKAAGSISYEITNVSKIVGDETFTNVLTSEGDGTVTYASNNTQVATVDAETGNVTIVGAGSATITATVTDGKNYTYDVTEATYTLTVGYQLDLKFAEGQTWATYYSKDNFLTVPDGLNAYVVTNISETTVSVTQIDYIPKEEPVLLELTGNTASTFVAQVYTSAIAQFNNLLQAGTTDIAVSTFETNVYVLYNNEFRRATSGSIPAYKGYLTTETAIAGAHLFISDGSATSIKRIAEEAEDEQWYTLDGRKLSGRPQIKGVYIRNGKKIYVSKK